MNRFIVSVAALVVFGATGFAQEPVEKETSDSLLEKRDQLKQRWQADKGAKDLGKAILQGKELVELERKLVQRAVDLKDTKRLHKHRGELAETLNWLAKQYEYQDDYDNAVKLRREFVDLRTAMFAKTNDHRIKTDALYLDYVEELSRMDSKKLREIAKARELYKVGRAHFYNYESKKAIKAFEERLNIKKQVLGEEHYQTVSSRTWLGRLHKEVGDYAKAKSMYKQALAIYQRKENLGPDHPKVATVHNNLGILYMTIGDYSKASAEISKSYEINKKALGPEDPETVNNLANLGVNLMWLGNYAEAKRQLSDSLKIREKILKPGAADIATNRTSLGLLYVAMGDYAKAEPLYDQALEALNSPSDARAKTLENQGLLYLMMGDNLYDEADRKNSDDEVKELLDAAKQKYAQSEEKFKNALEFFVEKKGDNAQDTINVRNNLALLYKLKGDHAGDPSHADASFTRAIEQYQKILGETLFDSKGKLHVDRLNQEKTSFGLAVTLNNLGSLYESQNNMKSALALYEKALAIRIDSLGENHIATAVSYSNLGRLKFAIEKLSEAESEKAESEKKDKPTPKELLNKSLNIRREMLEKMASVQNERQQLLMNQNLRIALDDWLSVVDDESAYAEVLRWKGRVFVHQAHLRALRSNPELESLVDQLRLASKNLAEQALKKNSDRDELKRWSDECHRLEIQLAQRSEVFGRIKQQTKITPADFQKVLGEKTENTAVVDLLEYNRFIPQKTDSHASRWERQIVAFVIRPNAVHRVELGPTKRIDKLVDLWHAKSRSEMASTLTEPAVQLRQVVWKKLEKYLNGIDTVLISPDGSLGRLPFAALPAKGEKSEKYLLEELTIGYIAVPQAINEILNPQANAQANPDIKMKNLLVLGGVDFDSAADSQTQKKSVSISDAFRAIRSDGKFAPLPGSKSELATIEQQYMIVNKNKREGITTLENSKASETAVRQMLPQHRYVHLATHGFFTSSADVPAQMYQNDKGTRAAGGTDHNQFIGYNPGLLSGLALAGVNNPRLGDDGRLTAMEVAELDLTRVRFAMLSACETGLGRTAGGEGVLGLQRAFHLAGARTVVASLWSVDDAKTRDLMVKFYENFWTKPTEDSKPLGKLQALRAAQLSLLEKKYNRGATTTKSKASANAKNPRTAPEYWAAFVLSGDWQ